MPRILILITCLLFGAFLKLDASSVKIEEPTLINQLSGHDVKIEVDTEKQQVRIFANRSLIKEIPCSTGMQKTPTPTGLFKTYEKVGNRAIELNGKKITYYFLSNFSGHIGFHSQIFGDHPMVQEGEQRFMDRQPSSQGCVRLLMSDAQWMYENIGLGAVVEVK